MKKTLSIIMALIMLLSCFTLTISVSAENSETVFDGYCGEEGKNLTWTLDIITGKLVISGTGEMKNFVNTEAPWSSYGISNIKDVIIDDGVTKIGERAFAGFYYLTSFTLPSSVSFIPESAFTNSRIENMYINDLNAWCNMDFQGHPFYYIDNLYLKNELITNLQIPDNVTVIKSGRFAYYDKLKNVTISNSVTIIEGDAFYNCQNIENITIGSGVQSIGEYAFAFCNKLSSIIIPNNVNLIKHGAFWDCIGLKQITIGNGVKTIEEDAFSYCECIESIYLTDIKAWCEISFSSPKSNPLYYADSLYLNDVLVTELTLPSEITMIKEYSFYNYYRLKDIYLPDNITYISSSAFTNCNNLPYNKYDNAYYLGNASNPYIALMYITNTDINSIQIHPLTKIIQSQAFYSCSNLTSVAIPEGVKYIGNYAFEDCSNLTSITVPNSVTFISDGIFSGCISLENVTIGNKVTSIGSDAFSGCISLTNIIIPYSVISIGDSAFRNCYDLKTVYIDSNTVSSALTSSSSCGYLIMYVDTILLVEDITTVTDYIKENYENKGISYEKEMKYTVYSKVDYDLITPPSTDENPEQGGNMPEQGGENAGTSGNNQENGGNNETSNSDSSNNESADNNGSSNDKTNNSINSGNSITTDSANSSTPNKDGEDNELAITDIGCGSSLFGGVALMTIATLGTGLIIKKKKQ